MTPLQLPLPGAFDDSPRLTRLVAAMCIDDALVFRSWRLERLRLATGREHYRLYRRGKLVGIADVTTPRKLMDICRRLALLLVEWGWCADCVKLREFGARTPLNAKKRDLPVLF